MPSVSDVYNELVQANARLLKLDDDVVALKGTTDAIKSSTDKIVTELQALVSEQAFVAQVLVHLSQQTDTVICAVEHISRNTCAILNESHTQTQLQTVTNKNVSELLELYKSAHPDAALELSRLQGLHQEIEKCCPPPVARPVCKYAPCPRPTPIKEDAKRVERK